MRSFDTLAIFFVLFLGAAVSANAQADRVNGKKNDRPGKEAAVATAPEQVTADIAFIYEFSRPGFVYQAITIRLDEKGKGTITFERNDSDEKITDPVALSAKTLDTIRTAFESLKLPDETPVLQYERDYSHLGNIKITRRVGNKEATVAFNWTENAYGKILMDEFRRVSNEYTWRFEMELTRSTQPLRTPLMITQIDRYLARGEISDPARLVEYLKTLANDEKLPLIARNHAERLVTRIERSGK